MRTDAVQDPDDPAIIRVLCKTIAFCYTNSSHPAASHVSLIPVMVSSNNQRYRVIGMAITMALLSSLFAMKCCCGCCCSYDN